MSLLSLLDVTLELDKFDHKFCGFMSKHDFTENPLARLKVTDSDIIWESRVLQFCKISFRSEPYTRKVIRIVFHPIDPLMKNGSGLPLCHSLSFSISENPGVTFHCLACAPDMSQPFIFISDAPLCILWLPFHFLCSCLP